MKVIEPELPPKTGDESHLIAWGALAVISLIALIVISRKISKEEDEERV